MTNLSFRMKDHLKDNRCHNWIGIIHHNKLPSPAKKIGYFLSVFISFSWFPFQRFSIGFYLRNILVCLLCLTQTSQYFISYIINYISTPPVELGFDCEQTTRTNTNKLFIIGFYLRNILVCLICLTQTSQYFTSYLQWIINCISTSPVELGFWLRMRTKNKN